MFFYWLFSYFPHMWCKFVVPCTEAVRTFWSSVRPDDPRLANGPGPRRADHNTKCVPMSLHGDGVPCTKAESVDVISIASLLGLGTSLDLKCMLNAFVKHCQLEAPSNSSSAKIWNIIIWSLRVLASGVFPNTDWDGVPYADGTAEHALVGKPFAGGCFFGFGRSKQTWISW